jgi:hypothetical protein
VTAMAAAMEAEIDYLAGQPGTAARLVFPLLLLVHAPEGDARCNVASERQRV